MKTECNSNGFAESKGKVVLTPEQLDKLVKLRAEGHRFVEVRPEQSFKDASKQPFGAAIL